ncbi:MAG: mucin desulfatase, partial [Clostridia bacterium]|nr:mucin desulfatase [Clostridia bacterium]
FKFSGRFKECSEIQSGNINNTYHLIYQQEDGSLRHYVLQQINSYAFKDPRAVMHNIQLISTHLRRTMLENGVCPW